MRSLDSVLQQHAAGLAGLQAVLIGSSQEGTALSAINYQAEAEDNDAIAGYAADLLSANARFCHIFAPDSPVDYVLGGSRDNKLLVRAIPNSVFFVTMVTSRDTAIKEILLRINAIISDAKPSLPQGASEEKTKAQALLDYAQRYAPDPAFVMMRLSLKTGIAPERLAQADLKDSELKPLYEGIKSILGVDRLPITL